MIIQLIHLYTIITKKYAYIIYCAIIIILYSSLKYKFDTKMYTYM